MTLAVQ